MANPKRNYNGDYRYRPEVAGLRPKDQKGE